MSANPQPIRSEAPSKFALARLPKGNTPASITTPNGETVIYLEQESTMYKQSYIYDTHVYAIPISQLSSFNDCRAFQNRLTKDSYLTLMSHFKLSPGAWILTANLAAGGRDPATIATHLPIGLLTSNRNTTPAPVKDASKAKKTKSTEIKKIGANIFALLEDESSSSSDDEDD
jgi:hypothetical protein